MKKLILITALVCLAGLNQLFAVNPIPSYNVFVSGKSAFQESGKPGDNGTPGKERRQMNIETSSASTPPPSTGFGRPMVSVVLYQIDGHNSMGPYYIYVGQSLSVGIDDSPWGVSINSESPSFVNVYTN